YDVSIACGERVLLPKVREASPDTLVVTDGFSCRTQIEQTNTGRHALHIAQVLQLAREGRSGGRYPEEAVAPAPEAPPARKAVRAAALAGAAAGLAFAGISAFRR